MLPVMHPETEALTSLVRLLDWDTAFWGFKTARILPQTLTPSQMTAVDRWCLENQIRCLYFLCSLENSQSSRIAESNGFHFADIRVTLECKLHKSNVSLLPDEPDVRLAHTDDLPALEQIARSIHDNTRFTYDSAFPQDVSMKMYEVWIRNSVNGNADLTLVSEDNQTVVGYITCHVDRAAASGQIGLLGVDKTAQGKGIGRTLVNSVFKWCQIQGLDTVTVVTQGSNYASQRLYQRCGFLTSLVQLWYHKWYDYPS